MHDAKLIEQGEKPINNINKLMMIIEEKFGDEYDLVRDRQILYRAYRVGYKLEYYNKELKKLIDCVCKVLNTDKEKLFECQLS